MDNSQHFVLGNGLCLVVPSRGSAYCALRFTSNEKRKQMALGKMDNLSLANARTETALKMKQHREGLDPLIEKKRAVYGSMDTVDELFADWLKAISSA